MPRRVSDQRSPFCLGQGLYGLEPRGPRGTVPCRIGDVGSQWYGLVVSKDGQSSGRDEIEIDLPVQAAERRARQVTRLCENEPDSEDGEERAAVARLSGQDLHQ